MLALMVGLLGALLLCAAGAAALDDSAGHAHFFNREELHGVDQDLIAHLLPLIKPNRNVGLCAQTQTPKGSLLGLNTSYISAVVDMKLPLGGETIVSPPRQRCTTLLAKAALTLPDGDFVETGTFFGTCSALMLRILDKFDSCGRKLWVFDSFEGLPAPTREDGYQGKAGIFRATEEVFMQNMLSTGALDRNKDKLVVTKGWFSQTCAASKVEKISFFRLDGDLFASTWDALVALYDRVVPGGFIYVDDYGSFVGCKKAVDKFRSERGIEEPLHFVYEAPQPGHAPRFEAVWWMKKHE